MSDERPFFKLSEHIASFRVLSVTPPVEEVTGASSGKIRSVRVRGVWTYRNFIGRGVRDHVEGMGMLFAENGETITYTLKGAGDLLANFGYRAHGTIKFRDHSRRRGGKLSFLHGKSGRFESVGRGKFVTKIWLN